ncbi:hypothetical protein [Bosea sp. PAMC 26642]|uniref:hypothetical protein n=1 Tax=Bosea sp. (strain PAMC 26642) TaxID=1792307 RepID=UPI0007700641|nr:hypothetical protein [Bosea sp. PAMC 26642]AMJ59418.1 hypothetical protein AXW83_03055 [Bosea sp. PAMC 26642]
MPHRQGDFADIPPITDFESCQKVRPLLLHRVGDILGVWRYCADKPCRRRKSCRRSDWACLTAFMDALPDEDRRLFRYSIENRRNGLAPDEAFAQAQARIAAEAALPEL